MKRFYRVSFVLVLVSLLLVGCLGTGPKKYNVSGTVVDADGNGIAGVALSFKKGNEDLAAATTDEDGKWSKTGLSGTILITPAFDDWEFDPKDVTVTKETKNIKFVGTPPTPVEPETYEVSGIVVDSEGAGIQGVSVQFFKDEEPLEDVTTDEAGEWAKDGLSGTVVIIPVLEGWQFTPERITVTEKATGLEFEGSELPPGEYGVSGVVRDLKGAGIKDVVLDFVQGEEILGTVTTDETGRWSKSGLAGVVKIVPRAENWKFEPGSLTVSIEDAGAVLNFVGTCYGYSISGTVVDREGDPVPGVQLLYFEDSMVYAMDSIADYAGRITTGPDGEWKIDSVNEIVTIVPVKTTYRFLPQVQEFVRASDGAKFIGLSGLTTHADGEGKITKEDLDESRVKLTAEATDDAYSFVAWLVTTVADNPDDPAGLIYVEEELEDESIIVTLDGPVKAIAYFQIVDAEPYIVGTFDVIHSFPMALEEEFADELAASSKLVTAPKFDAAVGDSFLQEYAGDERIVMFDHFDYDRQSAELSAAGWQVVDHIEILNAYLVERDPTVKLYKELNELTGVYSEERNGIVKLFGLKIPNDQFYFAQWHYHQIRLAQAWSVTTGDKDIRVAVVDTGIDPDHRDLKDNLDLEYMFDFTADGDGIDYHGHGTHVAGTIGALTDNEILMSGVMWEVTILPVKVFDASGGATNWTVVNGMLYAAGLLDQEGKPSNPNPVDIINLSLGGGWTQFEQDAVEKIDEAGIIIVAASGNDGNPMVSYPAAHPEVIAVGAVGKVNVNDPHGFTEPPLADYSNWGSALDVVAPGGAGRVTNDYVWSTYPSYLHPAGGEYAGMGGTSMACPHVAGVVGLMLANGIEKEDVRDILRRTSMEIHLPSPNVYFGHGLVNAYWAVNSLDDEDFRFIQGLRDGNTVQVENEMTLTLKGGSFHMYISPGDYQFIAWIDVNRNGIVDSGDYYAETPILEVKPGDGWRWMDEIAEVIMVTEDLEAAIANNRGEAVRIH